MEYITGGGMREEAIPPSLAREGEAMLRALVNDLLALSENLELVVMHDDRLPLPCPTDSIQTIMVTTPEPQSDSVYKTESVLGWAHDCEPSAFRETWLSWIDRCDAVWPIAPETDGILEQLCKDVESAGKALLSCPSPAVRLAASKLETAKRLADFGLPVISTFAFDVGKIPPSKAWVVKPDDGVGCENACIVRDPNQFQHYRATKGMIIQPLLDGEPISFSTLLADGKGILLSCNRQLIEQIGDRFSLRGCVVNAITDCDGRFQMLTEAIARAMPELWGYVGIDLMLTENGPVILEINPRLTTSYAGLREALGGNPAAWLLNLLNTGQLPRLATRTGKSVEIHCKSTL